MTPKRKWPAIDVVALYTNSNHKEWNNFLFTSLQKRDVETLAKTMYGLQLGMREAAKKKINTDKMNYFFLRLVTSIEKTVKQIYREVYPSPLDNPLYSGNITGGMTAAKKKRDDEFEKFLRESSY